MNYRAKAAAARLIQKIEGQVDPFDVAMGTASRFEEDLDEIAQSLGGNRSTSEMTPAGVAVYLLSLIIVNDQS